MVEIICRNTAFRVLLRHPWSLLLAMTLWWAFPLFIVNLLFHPFRNSLSLHTLYVIIFVLAVLSAILFHYFMSVKGIWAAAGNWERYYFCCGAYTIQMTLTLFVALLLDSNRPGVEIYGADLANCVLFLFIQSAVVYFVAGIIVKWLTRAFDLYMKRNRAAK